MKALSIKQPHAWLICKGYKDVENRNWKTGFHGRVYIHAGKKIDISGYNALVYYSKPLGDKRDLLMSAYSSGWLTIGAIIGEADIIDCKFRYEEENDNLYSAWHEVGQYGFVLANPVLYDKPIPCRGQLGFFEPEEEELVNG